VFSDSGYVPVKNGFLFEMASRTAAILSRIVDILRREVWRKLTQNRSE